MISAKAVIGAGVLGETRECDKVGAGDGSMPGKTAATNGTHQRKPARKSAGAKRPGRRESWKKVLERYLIEEGYSPAEAKELVAISAA